MPNIAELVFQSRRRNPFTVPQQSFILRRSHNVAAELIRRLTTPSRTTPTAVRGNRWEQSTK